MTHLDLIRWRRRMRWTQEQAAARLGMSRRTYGRIEAGHGKPNWRLLDLATSRLWDDKQTAMEAGWRAAA